jgi:hypothetical protein
MSVVPGRTRPLLVSVSALALICGLPAGLLAANVAPGAQAASVTALMAAASNTAKPKKAAASGADLLRQTQKSLAVVAATTKRLSRSDRKQAAPFVRAIGLSDRQMKAIKDAVARKDKKALAKAVSEASRIIGKLNSTYKLARIGDKRVAEGMRAFNASWNQTLKRLGGGKAKVTAESTKANGRRINAAKKRVVARKGQTQRREDLEQLALVIALLDEALLLNRSPEYQWMALARCDEAFGYYGGYYDYIAVYEPQYVTTVQEDYYYWNSVSTHYEETYSYYYEEYSFTSYEETVTYEYTESVEVSETIVSEEVVTYAEETIDTIETEALAVGAETDGYQEAAEVSHETEEAMLAAGQSGPAEDPAAIEDPEVDAAAEEPISDEQAEDIADQDEELFDESGETGTDDAGEPEAAPEESGEDAGDPPEEAAPEEEAQPEEAAPEEEAQPEEAAPGEEAQPDEAMPEEEAQQLDEEPADEEPQAEEPAYEEPAAEEPAYEEPAEEAPAEDDGDGYE